MENIDEARAVEPADEIEHFIHALGSKPQVVFAAPTETLRAVLVRAEIIRDGQDGIYVFVGECEAALSEAADVEDGVDDHAVVDIDMTLEFLEIRRHRHVHCHRCRHIAVDVDFAGMTRRHRFSPATTIGVVTQWARTNFPRLDKAAAAEYVLQIAGGTKQPRSDEHVGDLVEASTCSISFKLVKEITPQG